MERNFGTLISRYSATRLNLGSVFCWTKELLSRILPRKPILFSETFFWTALKKQRIQRAVPPRRPRPGQRHLYVRTTQRLFSRHY